MNTTPLFIGLILLLSACETAPSAFDRWLAKYELDAPLAYFEQSPDSFYVVSPTELKQEMERLDRTYAQLETLKDSILPSSHWVKRREYLAHMDSLKEKWSTSRNDPSLYNLPGYCKKLLMDNEISLPERLGFIKERLADSKSYYDSAKTLVRNPLPSKSLLAAQKHLLGLDFLQRELTDSLKKANFVHALKREFESELIDTRLIVKDYLAFCESHYFEWHNERAEAIK